MPLRKPGESDHTPAHIEQIENRQSNIILMVGDTCVGFETDNFGISDIRPIEKRA